MVLKKCIVLSISSEEKRPWLCDRKLDPKVSEAEEFDLIKTATECVYPLPRDGGGVAKKGKEEMEVEVLLESSVEALHDLLKELLKKELTTDGLDSIFKVNAYNIIVLHMWIFCLKWIQVKYRVIHLPIRSCQYYFNGSSYLK